MSCGIKSMGYSLKSGPDNTAKEFPPPLRGITIPLIKENPNILCSSCENSDFEKTVLQRVVFNSLSD